MPDCRGVGESRVYSKSAKKSPFAGFVPQPSITASAFLPFSFRNFKRVFLETRCFPFAYILILITFYAEHQLTVELIALFRVSFFMQKAARMVKNSTFLKLFFYVHIFGNHQNNKKKSVTLVSDQNWGLQSVRELPTRMKT